MSSHVRLASSYEEKFSCLSRNMRWEAADILRDQNLALVNRRLASISPRDTYYTKYGKRCFDVVVSAVALAVTLPINAVVAILTFFTLGRPLFFSQTRLGKAGKFFTIVKFRNMREESDENGHPLPGQLRVTRIGLFLRQTSIDELLNFWNVLKGDMSLIGPRPLVPEYLDRFSDRHRQRMAVKPGLECPPHSWEVKGDGYDLQFENDVWYAQNVSFATDLKMMCRLLLMVFDKDHARRRASVVKGSFMGYDTNGKVVDSNSIPEWVLNEVLRRHGRLLTPAPTLLQKGTSEIANANLLMAKDES